MISKLEFGLRASWSDVAHRVMADRIAECHREPMIEAGMQQVAKYVKAGCARE